jgi:hypothetical protein
MTPKDLPLASEMKAPVRDSLRLQARPVSQPLPPSWTPGARSLPAPAGIRARTGPVGNVEASGECAPAKGEECAARRDHSALPAARSRSTAPSRLRRTRLSGKAHSRDAPATCHRDAPGGDRVVCSERLYGGRASRSWSCASDQPSSFFGGGRVGIGWLCGQQRRPGRGAWRRLSALPFAAAPVAALCLSDCRRSAPAGQSGCRRRRARATAQTSRGL